MRCEAAERALSASLDGESLSASVASHVHACTRCKAFERSAQRVRDGVPVHAPEHVPNLTEQIMRSIAEEPGRRLKGASAAMPPAFGQRRSLAVLAVAAGLVGLVLGYAGLGGLSGGPNVAGAGDIAHEIRLASGDVEAYRARYTVTEFSAAGEEPKRKDVQIDFASPESFRLKVTARASSTQDGEPWGDGELRVDGATWWIKGGRVCPDVEACQAGALGVSGATLVTGRAPFDQGAPMPTDIVLPLASMSGTDALSVRGTETVNGHETVIVELAAADAAPLLVSFQQVGKWRPIWDADRVSVWLDAETWIPLRIETRASGGAERAAWAARQRLQAARAGDLTLRADLDHLDFEEPGPSVFEPGDAVLVIDEGFRQLREHALIESAVGFDLLVPAELAGLRAGRSGVFEDARTAVLSYADGLRWMRVLETQVDGQPSPLAQRVRLPDGSKSGGGVVYYEPFSDGAPRTVRVFAPGWQVTFEGNLTRQELLDAAGSIALQGRPADVRDLTSIEDLPAQLDHEVLLPTTLPPGARLVSSGIESYAGAPAGMHLVYARPETEPGDYALRIYEAESRSIPPAPGDDLISVQVRGRTGRWSPSQHELEWLESGLYVSLKAPALDLPIVLRIADDMEEVP